MPSWSITSLQRLPFGSPKQSQSSTPAPSSPSSSLSSSPLATPSSSSIWLATSDISPTSTKAQTGQRLQRRRRKRQTVDAQPKPVPSRLSSLFFPTSHLSAEQEEKCVYRASYAASFSDLLSLNDSAERRRRPVSDFWGGRQQSDHTTLDLSTPAIVPLAYSTPFAYPPSSAFSHSVGDFDLCLNAQSIPQRSGDPYLVLAPLDTGNRRVYRKSVDYSTMLSRKERAYSTSGPFKGMSIERGTEIWSSPFDLDAELSAKIMPPPPVPARSSLRPSASAHNLRDRASRPSVASSSSFILPVDMPSRPAFSPSTSARSQASLEQNTASSSRSPVTPSASSESTFILGRKKRPSAARGGSISGDPMRVKDGAEAKGSSSGVYTPPTFPGPQGQQNILPVASQSRVYTPATFAAPSPRTFIPPPPSPSRSTSVSSTSTVSSLGEVTTPRTPHTPLTPSSRFLGAWGSAVTGIKRASATLSTRSLSSPSSMSSTSYTPTSAREGYFSSTIYENAGAGPSTTTSSATGTPLAPSLWPTSPSTSNSASAKPYGLGLGLERGPEDAGYRRSRSESSATVTSEKGVLVGDVPKGKRKPVPRPAGEQGIMIKEEDEAETEAVVGYAM